MFSSPVGASLPRFVQNKTDPGYTLRLIIDNEEKWPLNITNGTVMVVQKFYEPSIDSIPKNPSSISSIYYKIIHAPDYSLIKFSVAQFIHLFNGLQQLLTHFDHENNPPLFRSIINQVKARYCHAAHQNYDAMACG